MIVVTGAAGFISSCLVGELNRLGHANIVVVDDFSRADKSANLEGKSMVAKISRKDFFHGRPFLLKKLTLFFTLVRAQTPPNLMCVFLTN